MGATVQITCADGKPIAELSKLIEQRSKWLNETAEQSCAACMLDILISLRALTAIAKPSKKEIVVSQTSLKPSFTGGKQSPVFCLRLGKARYTPQKHERIGFSSTAPLKDCKIWKWYDINKRHWLIVAPSQKDATEWAYNKLKKRAERFKGLARIALSKLMMMSGSKTSQQMDNANAASKASSLTKVTKFGSGNNYSLQASDLLEYAKLALKGGDSAINQAVMKASNKIASVINTKCKNLLSFEKLDTPFPEVRSHK